MTPALRSPSNSGVRGGRPAVHRAWWVAATTGLVVVVTGWSTGVPDVLADPLRDEFGWSRATIGFAFGVNMLLYGLTAPFAAAWMDRFGIRRVVAGALVITVLGAALTSLMTRPWQLVAGWGGMVGLGTGSLALTFAATVSNRWFVARRGLVSGVLTSASMFGGMGLMPVLAWLVEHFGWRAAVLMIGAAALILVPPVWSLLHDHPGDLGMKAHGADEFSPAPPLVPDATRRALALLRVAAGSWPAWMLAGAFAVCGASTNGIMLIHFVPAANEHGMPSTMSASLLAVMGVFNVIGAAGSGWLTDRMSARWLLVACYALRGVSLVLLPLLLTSAVHAPMVVFVVGYGLLDLATVPPTIALCRAFYGSHDGPVIFGWVSAAHALGAGAMAFSGGVARGAAGSYAVVWVGAGLLCALAAVLSLTLTPGGRRRRIPSFPR